MARPIIAFQSDELGQTATATLDTGTADSRYPVTNVQTFEPSQVFLTTTTGAVRIVWDHGSAVDVKVFSLHHYNIPAGHAGVKVQRHSANSWASPTIDATLTIPARPNDGLPLPIGLDLTAVSGYNGATGLRYSSLYIPSPSQLTGIGSALWWGAKRTDIRQIRVPFTPVESHPRRAWKTAYGRENRYRLGVRLRAIAGTLRTVPTDGLWLEWWRACRGDRAFLWWMDTSTSDAWLAQFGADAQDLEYAAATLAPARVVIEERACGLALPTA